jgi:hypothetical protein
VDDFAVAAADDRLLFGDNNGQVYYLDTSVPLITGSWESKQFGDGVHEITLDQLALEYTAHSNSQVEASIAVDGEETFGAPILHTLTPGSKNKLVVGEHGRTGKLVQIRLRFLSGTCMVTKLHGYIQPRSRR